MRKRPHWFAVVLWAFSVIYVVSNSSLLIELSWLIGAPSLNTRDHVTSWLYFWNDLRGALSGALILAGFGILIETVDRIRLSFEHGGAPVAKPGKL